MVKTIERFIIKVFNFLYTKHFYILIILPYFIFPFIAFWRNLDLSNISLVFFDAEFDGSYYPDFVYGVHIFQDIIKGSQSISSIFWNPYSLLGMPWVGAVDRSGLFYPIKFLFYFISSFFSSKYYLFFITYFPLFHMSLAGIFTYLFVKRCLKLSSFSSFVAGIIYGFSGAFIFLVIYIYPSTGVAFLPLQLYFLWTALEKNSFRRAILAGFATALVLLSGYSPLFIYNSIFISLVIFYFFAKNLKTFITTFGFLFITHLTAIFLSAVVLLPNMEQANLAARQIYNVVGAGYYNTTVEGILNYFVPYFYGVKDSGNVYGYVGILSLFLIYLALKYSNKSYVKFFVVISFFFLVLSLGNLTFLHSLIYKIVPLYDSMRRPAFLNYIVTFGLAILVAIGVNILENRKISFEIVNSQIKKIFIAFSLFWFGLFILKAIVPPVPNQGTIAEMIRFSLIPLIVLGSSVILIKYFYVQPSRFFKVFLVLIILFDLFTLNSSYPQTNSELDPRVFNTKSEIISSLDDKINEDYSRAYFLESGLRYNSSAEKLYQLDGYYGFYSNYYSTLMTHYFNQTAAHFDFNSPVLDLLGVSYIITTKTLEKEEPKKIKMVIASLMPKKDKNRYTELNGTIIPVGSNVYAYENLDRFPRVYLVGEVKSTTNDEEALSLMDTLNLRESAVVASSDQLPKLSLNKSESLATIIDYQNSQVKISASSKGSSFLVLSDSYYPGWKAYVDEKPVEIYRTNVALRGVFLDDGEHEVKFVYQPDKFYLGAYISIISLITLLIFLIFPWKRFRPLK
ncbi:MAG: YfhO family protein [Candidatus Roizmanbacteria bacterium]|nr:MAG: YfhO family protein [Candidatus Roizmanbacteria bacterium]